MWFLDDKFFDGRHEFLPSLHEVLKAFLDLSVADLAIMIGAVLWIVLLALSLKTVDRRDPWTGVTYALFMTAAGVILMLALPERIRGSDILNGRQVVMVLAMPAVAGIRWIWRRAPTPRAVSTAARNRTPKKEP